MNTPAEPSVAEAATLHISVCYATARQEILRELNVAPGTTIADAILASGILNDIAKLAASGDLGAIADPRDPGQAGIAATGLDPALHQVGIFGKKKSCDTVLRNGDRVELYRPLLADPNESRRRRAGARPRKGD